MKLFRTVVDSTGVKVYGEGEWKTRVHGVSKRRTWGKLHLGVNEATGEIVSGVVTTNDVSDSQAFSELEKWSRWGNSPSIRRWSRSQV